ncbi:MAG: Ku protein [Actinobacteria bacterium]|nr:Ku protein [Actinomycetota bacterium]
MPRAIWSGPISFGLVNIPISLYPATRGKSVSFRQLHAADNTPINYAKVCPNDGKTLSGDEIVNGYEFEKGRFVVMEDKDFEAVTIRKGRAIEIINFFDIDEVDPIYYQKSYYLAPVETSQKAFRLLVAAMERQNKAALAKFSLGEKQHLSVLRPKDGALLLETLYYQDEVRSTKDLDLPGEDVVLDSGELELAEGLMERMTAAFDLARFRDEYRDELLKIINQKIEGREIAVPELAPLAPVVDIMDALKKSIARQEEEKKGAAPKRRRRAS